jgi:elongation factor 1-beta
MGTVAIKIRVMPDGPDVDLSTLETTIRALVASNGAEFQAVEIKPFAFGLKSMDMVITMDDKTSGGASEKIEEALGELTGVQSAEVLEVGLL